MARRLLVAAPMSQPHRDLPHDFLEHLQITLGTPEDVTVYLLGEWLESYEPISVRRSASAQPARENGLSESRLEPV